jgi:hypothetical protein
MDKRYADVLWELRNLTIDKFGKLGMEAAEGGAYLSKV